MIKTRYAPITTMWCPSPKAEKSIELEEEDVETFETFLQWLYDDEIDEIEIDKENQWGEPLLGRMKLFLFAEQFNIEVLADYAMDTIVFATQEWLERDFTQPPLEIIHLVYENTGPGSGLRFYLAKCSAICNEHGKSGPLDEEIDDYMKDGNAPGMYDLIDEYTADAEEHLPQHPALFDICAYHCHERELNCFTRSRKEAEIGEEA